MLMNQSILRFPCVAALQDEIVKVRDASTQSESIGVPEEHLSGHAFHTYRYSPQCPCSRFHSCRRSHRQSRLCWSACFLSDEKYEHIYSAGTCSSRTMHAAFADCLCNTCAKEAMER